MTATAIAGVVGGPLSGLLLTLHGIAGLAGWQWLFIVEGLPAIIMDFVVLNYLCERPEQAEWLEPEERFWLQEMIAARIRTQTTPQQLHFIPSSCQS
ncbi:hypothetical protein [Nostoc sp.]|uniref:hypothetical protein n=1 Tax=Nostoc sp. TaxID=1180 RepID=UPI002FF7D4BF